MSHQLLRRVSFIGRVAVPSLFLAVALALSNSVGAQQLPAQAPFSAMPRHSQYQKVLDSLGKLRQASVYDIQWDKDGKAFTYRTEQGLFKFEFATGQSQSTDKAFDSTKRRFPFQRQAPGRGRQYGEAFSANGKWKAESQNGNVELIDSKSGATTPVTTESTPTNRIKFGVASWVYGEELGVRDAMWFSPDSNYLGFYRYDESQVKDYFIAYNQLQDQDTLNTEPYPIPGEPNPKASVLIYNIKTKKTVPIDSSFGDANLGYYIFEVNWSPDGSELLYFRANRVQNHLQFCAADPATGKSRVIVDVARTDGWVDTNRYNNLKPFWLKDGQRFIWTDDQSGYRNLYLYNMEGKMLGQITHQTCDVEQVLTVDEDHGWVYYTARNADNPYLFQLNRVKLNGTEDQRLTDPSLSHTCTVSPTGAGFVDVAENFDSPPVVTVANGEGKVIATLVRNNLDTFSGLHLQLARRFTVKAADGKTDLYGYLEFPSDFDPNKKYPMVCLQYGGPESGWQPENFVVPNALTEFGFILMHIDCRGSAGRGRAFMVSVYRKLGQVEIDDNAQAVKELCQKYRFIDPNRVGIEGTSYGGYFAALSILRHPETYAAACASSPVTDFRLYDTIYTERYMGLPTAEDNQDGYEKGSCMTYAKDLKGRLMLYFGSADNNVHPANTFRLAQALTNAGKRYDMMVGPDEGHSAMNYEQEWEYFIRNLILTSDPDPLKSLTQGKKDRFAEIVKATAKIPKNKVKKGIR